MESTLYVRVEGVNLANFIEDVHDLSTIRGGSFLLLEAIGRVQDELKLQPVSTGASSGVFTAAEGDEEALRGRIEKFLHDDPKLRHATFVVDVFRGDFMEAREALLAMNRWRQFQQPTLAVPTRPAKPVAAECGFDHVRPATETIHVKKGDGEEPKPASASVKHRRDFGRNRKTHFYEQELRRAHDASLDSLIEQVSGSQFVLDLEALADDESRGSLSGKIGVVYFDGNKFGSMQKGLNEEKLASFDRTVKSYRRSAIARLLQEIFERPDGWWTANGQIRLETLLWGGDELLWVVPAWKAWEVVRLFYDVSSTWVFDQKPLTHAGGLVLCHRSAPIHRMTKIAKLLAESCKKETRPASRAEGDRFAYQVLESFDEIGPRFETFRAGRLSGVTKDDLVVRAAGMREAISDFDSVRRQFPRSKLHDIINAFRDDRDDVGKRIDGTVKQLPSPVQEALRRLFRFFGADGDRWSASRAAWLHVAELWDYAIAG